jgi:hypothetical protein
VHAPLPGLTRQSIFFEKFLRRGMDARAFASPKRLRPRRRVKPAHDERVGAGFSRTGIGLPRALNMVFAMAIAAMALYMLPRNLSPT